MVATSSYSLYALTRDSSYRSNQAKMCSYRFIPMAPPIHYPQVLCQGAARLAGLPRTDALQRT